MHAKSICILLCSAAIASAALPVATITASGSFSLSGVTVPASAAASIPAGAGDVLTSLDVPVVMRFADRGIIMLAAQSKVGLEQQGGMIVIRLEEGSLEYRFAAGSKLTIRIRKVAVEPALQGVVTVPENSKVLPIAPATTAGAAAILTAAPLRRRGRSTPW